MYDLLVFICLRLALAFTLTASFISAATLSGLILDNTGKPITKANVTIHRKPVSRFILGTEDYLVSSSADGSYSLSGLSPGTYFVCASSPGSLFTNACNWPGNPPPSMTIALFTDSVNQSVTLALGCLLSVQVDDPSHLLPAATVDLDRALPITIQPAQGHFVRLHRSAAGTGFSYQAVVPANLDLTLMIAPTAIVLRDDSGGSITSQQPIALRLSPGTEFNLHFTVGAQ